MWLFSGFLFFFYEVPRRRTFAPPPCYPCRRRRRRRLGLIAARTTREAPSRQVRRGDAYDPPSSSFVRCRRHRLCRRLIGGAPRDVPVISGRLREPLPISRTLRRKPETPMLPTDYDASSLIIMVRSSRWNHRRPDCAPLLFLQGMYLRSQP